MAYSELIKNINRIRAYLRSFYVFGFMHREEFTQKSARSYDNERRRVESWLGEYMSFGQDADGRRVFLSVDSRAIPENPLYRAFRTKSFTERDIMLHFYLLDILKAAGGCPEGGQYEAGLSITGIMDELSDRLSEFEDGTIPDESTVRKKLREYASLGIFRTKKRGRETIYMLSEDRIDLSSWNAAAAFFSEAAPLGVTGSYMKDRMPEKIDLFRFKHHYILNALDSEILSGLLEAIGKKQVITFTSRRQHVTALPLKLYIGTQTGRQYLLAWTPENDLFSFYRADLIDHINAGGVLTTPEDLPERIRKFCSHTWGVTGSGNTEPVHLEMTVYAGREEEHIVKRLEREKRSGVVQKLDETHWKFSADVYSAYEMLPWLRTFTGRVTGLQCSDPGVTERFWEDFDALEKMYGGERDAVS